MRMRTIQSAMGSSKYARRNATTNMNTTFWAFIKNQTRKISTTPTTSLRATRDSFMPISTKIRIPPVRMGVRVSCVAQRNAARSSNTTTPANRKRFPSVIGYPDYHHEIQHAALSYEEPH